MSTAELFTVGQLARRTGVPARTIRFWSDQGLVPPAARSAAGYRLYDAEAVARLELVRALRELGLSLELVQAVLSRTRTVADVAAAHVAVLDGQIRSLRLRRAVLATVAKRGNTIEETLIMNKLARLSAQERQHIIDDFVDEIFTGAGPQGPDAPVNEIARGMRQMPAELPDDPSPEQADAWIELAELAADPDFRQRVRSMAVAGQQGGTEPGRPAPVPDYQKVIEHAQRALAQGSDPGSPASQAIVDQIVPADTPPAERAGLLSQLQTFTDARVERYWQLLAIINDRPVPPSVVPAFEWLIAALRADPRQLA
jgi:DNA-binding transcriptional MerR regulator